MVDAQVSRDRLEPAAGRGAGLQVVPMLERLQKHVLGNVRENSIVEAWNNPFYKKVRLEVNKGNPTLDICRACFGREKTSPAENGC